MKVVLQDLTKVFPSRKKGGDDTVAVDHFTFEIPDGQLLGLLGPSGCGKSTTLYMISGLQTPTKGKIFFGDQDVTALPAEARGGWACVSKLCSVSPPDGAAKHSFSLGKSEGEGQALQA